MTEHEFWEIIDSTLQAAKKGQSAQKEKLAEILSRRSTDELIEFDCIYNKFLDQAYTWDLWGAAYIMGGGCSDDAFIDFRSWLISRGKDVYYNALSDPESLVDVEQTPVDPGEVFPFFEDFEYVVDEVYEDKTGEELPELCQDYPPGPQGEEWEESDEALSRRFPKLWAKFGGF
jgi:hypothetical protein